MPVRIQRLSATDLAAAQATCAVMQEVFEEPPPVLTDAYLGGLLASEAFLLLAAFDGQRVVGGLTAHVLPMTRTMTSELFVYDLAVSPAHHRRGIGRALVHHAHQWATERGIGTLFVPVDAEDDEAIAFYRAIGGHGSPVELFVFEDAHTVDG
jgi:aminoglycoside 3-N-acetyltransferase I